MDGTLQPIHSLPLVVESSACFKGCGMTQYALAKVSGVTKGTLSRFLAGDRTSV